MFSYPYILWMLVFILCPMVLIFYYAFVGNSGFTFDYQNPIDFSTQYAEISALKNEYFKNIQCGAVDPDDPENGVPALKAKMEAAGLNDIIAEAQRQLDAYLAKKAE